MRALPVAAFLACSATLASCSGGERGGGAESGDVGGTVIISAPAEPASLLPPLVNSTSEKQVVDQIFDGLAEIGPNLDTFGDSGWTPRLASSWSWSPDSLSITFTLDPRARWHDGQPVRASDVRFSLAFYRDPKVQSYVGPDLANVDSVSAPDSVTAVAWFHQRAPEQFYKLVYNLQIIPEHLLRDVDRATLVGSSFARNPVGSGPFAFGRWESRTVLELTANSNYHLGRPKLDRVIWALNPDPSTAATKVLAGEADFVEVLSLDAIRRVSASREARAVPYRALNHGFLVFNLRDARDASRPHPVLADRALRVALSMAMDRRAMLTNVFDSLALLNLGPFTRAWSAADTTIPQIPYDTAGAARMLDSLGWRDANGDGVRERNGIPLRIGVLLPSSSVPRQKYGVLIQEQLRRVGARVDLDEVEISVMMPRMFSGKFDAILHSLGMVPSPSGVHDNWSMTTPKERTKNLGMSGDARVDALLDSAVAASDPVAARTAYRQAFAAVAQDAPAVWLYESKPHAAMSVRVRAVLGRTDFWWRDMRNWWIPAGERIARDMAGK